MTTREPRLPPSLARDCRKFQRYAFRTQAKALIYPVADGQDQHPKLRLVMTCDLSRGGISFLYSKPLAPNQRVDLDLSDGRKFTLCVRRINRVSDGWYAVGCRFTKVS
jgi:hypothetical protein